MGKSGQVVPVTAADETLKWEQHLCWIIEGSVFDGKPNCSRCSRCPVPVLQQLRLLEIDWEVIDLPAGEWLICMLYKKGRYLRKQTPVCYPTGSLTARRCNYPSRPPKLRGCSDDSALGPRLPGRYPFPSTRWCGASSASCNWSSSRCDTRRRIEGAAAPTLKWMSPVILFDGNHGDGLCTPANNNCRYRCEWMNKELPRL